MVQRQDTGIKTPFRINSSLWYNFIAAGRRVGRLSVIVQPVSTKKSEQLGMSFSTACNRLRKMIMHQLVQQAGRDECYRCGEIIETPEELSIEHKEDWLDVDPDLFWDLDNIEFSHVRCNTSVPQQIGRDECRGGCGRTRLQVEFIQNRRWCKECWNSHQKHKMRSRRA